MVCAGLVAVSERTDNGGPVLNGGADESIAHVAPGVAIVFGQSSPQQPGTLYITTRRLVWLSDNDNQKGYGVDFLSLSMHAISRDPEAYAVPCIYTQIESGDDDEDWGEEEEMETGNHVEEILSAVEEMRLVPRDPNVLDQLFQVLCDCALLNPDPDAEQEGEADWYFNANEVLGQPAAENNHVDVPDISELHIQDPRFADAEEELEEDKS